MAAKPVITIHWTATDKSTWRAKDEDEALHIATVLTEHLGASTTGERY